MGPVGEYLMYGSAGVGALATGSAGGFVLGGGEAIKVGGEWAWMHATGSTGLRMAAAGTGAMLTRLKGRVSGGGDGAGVPVRFDPARAGHIFREAAGYMTPASPGSQARFARLFENVASNPTNLRADAVQAGIITQDAANAGVRAFTWIANGGQVWVTVRDGVIQNAGVNSLGAFR